ncbi:MAG TPA: tetratricopeptide repeat protein [Pyrinomonadaceae bacterium]|nr:tetratricopeptide repeat protein [Pyrinomonadaceae bacterium]
MQKIILLVVVGSTILIQSSAIFAQTQTRARTVAAEQDVDNTADPVASLREQIAGAADDSERNRLQLKLADLLLTGGHRAEAIAELNKIASSNSFDPIGFYNLGNSFARLGEAEPAMAAYRTAIEQRKGQYSRAYNNLGVMLLRTGKWDEAQEALLSALKLESFHYAEASYNLGRVYAAKGQNDLAAREWRRALAVDPKHDAAAQALAREGKDNRVVVATKKPNAIAGPTEPQRYELDQASFELLQRARTASERGQMTDAVDNFRRLLSRQHGYFPPANLELGFALLTLNRVDEALPNLLEVSKRDGSRYPISYYHLARLYEIKGELKLAEAAFAQAAATYQPTNAPFLLDLSRVREKLGDYKGSLEAMESYQKLMQDHGLRPSWFDERIAALRSKATRQN